MKFSKFLMFIENNIAADLLDSYHPPRKWMDVSIEEFAPELLNIVKEDKEGKMYRHNC